MPSEADHGLTHVDETGAARMVDVAGKDTTVRTATAAGALIVSPETAALVAGGGLPKGDAITVARIAGIQAAKRTSELIPLCHQIAMTGVDVEIEVDETSGRVEIEATARAADRTGVEMEALVAVGVSGLTLYDMVKAVERGARLTDVRLVAKSGGRSGDWSEAAEAP